MNIGEKIKLAIEGSKFSAPEVAAHADMSKENLYKIYKSDSVQTRYLVPIAEKLGLPITYFLDEKVIDLPTISVHSVGNTTGGNYDQKIMPGAMMTEPTTTYGVNITEIETKLKVCQAEKAGLERIIALKDKFIDLLEKNQAK